MVFFLYFAIFSGKIDNTQFITARKRSLGQGNMFTGVCLSTGGVPGPGGLGEAPGPGGVPGLGGCLVLGGSGLGGAWWRPPRGLLLRAVRILVFFFFRLLDV